MHEGKSASGARELLQRAQHLRGGLLLPCLLPFLGGPLALHLGKWKIKTDLTNRGSMEPQLVQGSPKRKECLAEERVVQLEDLRTLLKEERQCFKEELKSEIKNLSTSMMQTLERFQGELGTVSSKVEGVQQTMEVYMARVGDRQEAGSLGESQHDPGI